jgi:hypothetical protein
MTVWDNLSNELDAWAATGKTAEFWWRDDDAIDATPALDRLLSLRRDLDVPLALAVIPANARPMLAASLRGESDIDILQHGYAHINHRPDGEKKAELRADRELWDIARELAEGRGCMIRLFGDDGWQGVMVPPWNRIDLEIVNLLPGLGFHGLTTFEAREAEEAAPGLTIVNTHVDIIDWPGTRAFAGDDIVIGAAVAHLSAKREGRADAAEATGLLTHHLAQDEACWEFVEQFCRVTKAHPAAVWQPACDIFAVPS